MKLQEIEQQRRQVLELAKAAVVSTTLKKVNETTQEAIENARISALVIELNRASSDN